MRRPKLPKLPVPSKLRRRAAAPTAPQPRPPSPAPAVIHAPQPTRKVPVVAIVVALVVVAVALVIVLKACGGDDEQQVRDTLQRFGQAVRKKDNQALCDDLLSTKLVEQLRAAGLPCEIALRKGLADVNQPTLKVLSVDVNGDDALAKVDTAAAGQPAAKATLRLVHEDSGWRITSLPGEQPAGTVP